MASRTPFSRHRAGGRSDDRSPGERVAGAYEFAAAEWGWTVDHIEGELTDALFVWYLDAAYDRVSERSNRDYQQAVEVVRAGVIFAHDQRQYSRWRASVRTKPNRGAGLVGQALEAAVMRIAEMFPDNVQRVTV